MLKMSLEDLEGGRGVGISKVMKHTHLSFQEADAALTYLDSEGVVRYLSAEQQSGAKVAYLVE